MISSTDFKRIEHISEKMNILSDGIDYIFFSFGKGKVTIYFL